MLYNFILIFCFYMECVRDLMPIDRMYMCVLSCCKFSFDKILTYTFQWFCVLFLVLLYFIEFFFIFSIFFLCLV